MPCFSSGYFADWQLSEQDESRKYFPLKAFRLPLLFPACGRKQEKEVVI